MWLERKRKVTPRLPSGPLREFRLTGLEPQGSVSVHFSATGFFRVSV